MQFDCDSALHVDDESLVDLSPIGIKRRSSGQCATGGVDRMVDYEAAHYRVWLDQLIALRAQLLAENPTTQPTRIVYIDGAIQQAVMVLTWRDEEPGPLPFKFTEEDFPPVPTVTLDDVIRANNTTPKQFIGQPADGADRGE